MSLDVKDTQRCKLFEGIAAKVWDDINHHHNVNIDMPEIGITSRIVADILTYRQNFEKNFDVYARKAYDENTFGGDLDIFVETSPNRYRWFALQAKVLKSNKKYDTVRYSGKTFQQWESLKMLDKMTGCKGFYLLYNGMNTLQSLKLKTDSCYRMFAEEQFGCSIVKLKDVEKIGSRKYSNGNFITPSYSDIHPVYAQPWRTLVCCYLDNSEDRQTMFSIEEIEGDCKNYYPAQEDFISERDKPEKEKFDINNKISMARQEANWKPDYRVIIKRSDSV